MKTKDYIYLDENFLNSHLAQFEKGLLTKETSEHGTESADSISGFQQTHCWNKWHIGNRS